MDCKTKWCPLQPSCSGAYLHAVLGERVRFTSTVAQEVCSRGQRAVALEICTRGQKSCDGCRCGANLPSSHRGAQESCNERQADVRLVQPGEEANPWPAPPHCRQLCTSCRSHWAKPHSRRAAATVLGTGRPRQARQAVLFLSGCGIVSTMTGLHDGSYKGRRTS